MDLSAYEICFFLLLLFFLIRNYYYYKYLKRINKISNRNFNDFLTSHKRLFKKVCQKTIINSLIHLTHGKKKEKERVTP